MHTSIQHRPEHALWDTPAVVLFAAFGLHLQTIDVCGQMPVTADVDAGATVRLTETRNVWGQMPITAHVSAGTAVCLSETHVCHDAAGQIHGSFDEGQSQD